VAAAYRIPWERSESLLHAFERVESWSGTDREANSWIGGDGSIVFNEMKRSKTYRRGCGASG